MSDLEEYSNRRLVYRDEVSQLIDLARSSNKMQVFEDAVFKAKFITKAFEVMKRIGPEGEGYDKMAQEFREGIEKANSLLKTLVKESEEGVKNHFMHKFFGMDQGSLNGFLGLLGDLAWVKNWTVDGKPLP